MEYEDYERRMRSFGLPGKNKETGYTHLCNRLKERYGIEFHVKNCRHLKNLMETESGKEQLDAHWVRNKPNDREEWDVSFAVFGYPITIRILRHAISGHIFTVIYRGR